MVEVGNLPLRLLLPESRCRLTRPWTRLLLKEIRPRLSVIATTCAFSATLIAQGTGTGIVVTTGDFTEIGTINALVMKVKKKTTCRADWIPSPSGWPSLSFFTSTWPLGLSRDI
jgi:magnesium-transporting ATPase (P-type)